MALFKRMFEARRKARMIKEEDNKITALISRIQKGSKKMSKDDRVSMLLDDIDNAFSFNVSHISICNRSNGNRYDNAVFIYCDQPRTENGNKPTPIPPTQFNFANYDLFLSADEAYSLLYLIFRTYAGENPRYCEPIWNGLPESTYNSLEEAVRHYQSDRDSSCTMWSGIRTICFPDSLIKIDREY